MVNAERDPSDRRALADHRKVADEDAQRLLRAVIERAEQDARLLASVLPRPEAATAAKRNAGDRQNASPTWAPFKDGLSVQSVPIPEPVAKQLVKLVAAIRLNKWERADLTRHLKGELPASDEVYADLRHRPGSGDEKFPAGPTAARVLETWLRQMAWKPLDGSTDDVVIDSRDGEQLINEVANLLWQLRHLGYAENHDDDDDDRTDTK